MQSAKPCLNPVASILAPSALNTCAVVVAYHPDAEFETRLERVLSQVACLLVVDNTPEPIVLSDVLRVTWASRLHWISNAKNKGIAAAINQGLAFAAAQGYSWLLTLDQDSSCYPDIVAILGSAFTACPLAPVILGSNYFDPSNHKYKVLPDGEQLWLEQKTVITSGCLVNVGMACALCGLREDYFIDQVDHEFCLRARANGHHVVITRKPTMEHRVGLPGGVRLPWFGVLPNHSPTRKYYIARNTVVTVLHYWRGEPMWCFKRLVRLGLGFVGMLALEPRRRDIGRAFALGVKDGLRARMGKYIDAE